MTCLIQPLCLNPRSCEENKKKEGTKWRFSAGCCCCCWVASVVSDSVRPHRRQPTRLPRLGILQARTLEWISISFSNAWKWKVKVKLLSRAQILATPWSAAHQAPPSMGFSRQEYWSGVPLPYSPPNALPCRLPHNFEQSSLRCTVGNVICSNIGWT